MKALKIFNVSQNAARDLDCLYRTTRDAQLRTRVHMVLLSVEKGLIAAEIAESFAQTSKQYVAGSSVINRKVWMGCTNPHDLAGPRKVTEAYLSELMEVVRQNPPPSNCPSPRGPTTGWPTSWRKRPVSP